MSKLTAPENPEKRRPFFYIMREKSIFGSKQPDGTGIQFLYQNDGRLISSAQIAGNITDAEELELLKTAEGFRKLVHSIGVSAECEEPEEEVEFVFQIYGKQDIYGGGTSLRAALKGDGAEKRVYLSEADWQEDDHEPGQIRFVMHTPEKLATVSVRFYLNDGYTAPEEEAELAVDFSTEDYQAIRKRSLLDKGNTARLQKAIQRAKEGEKVTLAYIGGSITQGAGATPISTESYAYKSYKIFEEKYGRGNNIQFIKAGVGGTPSELGMIRFDRDVLREGERPDVVVVEFAVNDEGDETKGECYESLVRKVLSLPWKPAVILLFSVFADDYNLQERLMPVGEAYQLPMVSIKNGVSPQFRQNRGEGKVLSKNQFFYDIYHPSNIGHTVMADCLGYLFETAGEQLIQGNRMEDETQILLSKPPVIGNAFENVKLLDRKDRYAKADITCGAFEQSDRELQCVEMDDKLEAVPEFPYNWHYDGESDSPEAFSMTITCRALVLVFKDSGETDAGKAEVFADGRKIMTADPHKNGWCHCNPVILLREKESRKHLITIKMADGEEHKKFTILGFGYVI